MHKRENAESKRVAEKVQPMADRLQAETDLGDGGGARIRRLAHAGMADAEGEAAPGGVGVIRDHAPGDEIGTLLPGVNGNAKLIVRRYGGSALNRLAVG